LSPDSAGGRRSLAGVGRRDSAGGDRWPRRAPVVPLQHHRVTGRRSLSSSSAATLLACPPTVAHTRRLNSPTGTYRRLPGGHTTPPHVRHRRASAPPSLSLRRLVLPLLPFFDVAPLSVRPGIPIMGQGATATAKHTHATWSPRVFRLCQPAFKQIPQHSPTHLARTFPTAAGKPPIPTTFALPDHRSAGLTNTHRFTTSDPRLPRSPQPRCTPPQHYGEPTETCRQRRRRGATQ